MKNAEEYSSGDAEQHYRILFEHIDQGFCLIDQLSTEPVDFKFILSNPAFENHTGLKNVEGKRMSELTPNVEESILAVCAEVVRTGETQYFETYIADIDRWMQAKVFDGKAPGRIGILFSNITERKQTELALHKSEHRYKRLFETMIEGYCIIELLYDDQHELEDMIIREINPAFEQHSGLSNVLNQRVSKVLPNFEEFWLNVYKKVAQTGHMSKQQEYVKDVDRWFETIKYPLGGKGSRYVAVVFNDITESKRAEIAIRESEERLRLFMMASNSMVYRMSPDWKQMQNLVGKEMLADTPEPIADWIEKYIPQTERMKVQDHIDRAIKNKTIFELEHQVFTADGAVGWVHSKAIPLLDAQGEIREWFGSSSDITIRKRTQAALQESETKYRTLFENIDEGFTIQELLIDENNRVVDMIYQEVNDAYEKHSGIGHALGKKASELFQHFEQHWLDAMTRVYQTGEPVRTEGYQADIDRWFTLQYASVGGAGSNLISVLFNDITVRKRQEQEQAYFLTLSDVLRSSADPKEIEDMACRLLGESMKVTSVYFCEVLEEQRIIRIDSQYLQEGAIPMPSQVPIEAFDWGAVLLRRGDTVVVPDIHHSDILPRAYVPAMEAIGARSCLVAPLIKNGQWLGTLSVNHAEPREWKASDVSLVRETLERLWASAQRARTENALRQSEEKYRSLFDTMDEGLSVFTVVRDASGKVNDLVYKEVNAAVLRQTGAIRECFIGRRLSELSAKKDFEIWLPLHALVADTGKPLMGETYAAHTGRWFEYSIYQSASDENSIFVRDISARKHTEEALRQSEEKYRTLFASIDEGFSILELYLDDKGKVVDFVYLENNPAFIKQVGMNLQGKKRSEIFFDQKDFVLEKYNQLFYNGEPLHFEYCVQSLGEQWFQVTAVRIGGKGSKYLGVVFRNVTARKEREKHQQLLLRLSDNLGQANDLQGVQTTVTNLLREHYHAGWCYYVEWDEEKKAGVVLCDSKRDDLPSLTGIHDVSDVSEFLEILKSGKILMVNDYKDYEFLSSRIREKYTAAGFRAMLVASLVRQGKLISSLIVGDTKTRKWSSDDENLLTEVADRTWAALERTRAEEALKDAQTTYRLQLEKEVTERTAELLDSRDQLRSILNTTLVQMSFLSAIRDGKGQIVDFEIKAVNQELEKETGRKDLVGKRYAKEYPGIRQTGLFMLIVQAIDTGKPQSTEYYYPHEGFQKWFSCMFVKHGDGVVATNMDITAKKQAEEERFKNYLLLQKSEEIALLGSWEYNMLTGVFTWSEGMYRLFDLEREQEVRPEIYLDYATESSMETAKRVVDYIRSGTTDFEETLEIKLGDRVKVIHLKAAAIRGPQGHPVNVLGVDLDITALRSAEGRLRKLEAQQQREIFETSLSTVEEERSRISESLHNGIAQILYGAKINLSGFEHHLSEADFKETKSYISQLLTEAIIETRRISHELMPTTLDRFGLKSAINDICTQLSDGTKFTCKTSGLHLRMEKFMQLAVFRTVQELMTNVVKHAEATKCEVSVIIGSNRIAIHVHDNGKGMDSAKSRKPGIGLAAIRSKIKLLNGLVNVTSAPGEGTAIEVIIPQPEPKPKEYRYD